ncbi:MAG: hypothetical protein OEU54_07220 [Gemmatimonadota bacterium]|nr:hypothetical protein [Gemmatimonadota bacterium]
MRRLPGIGATGLLIAVLGTAPSAAQDPPPPDSVVEVIPDSLRGAFDERSRDESQAYPERRYDLRGPVTEVFDCDAECLRSSTGLSLLDLLGEFLPGVTQIRGGYLAGPHHLMEGPYGAGFVALFVDGREVPSLESAQTDMRRLSLVYLERVRVYRGSAGLIVDVDTYRHQGRAYSRIGGGTGDPQLSTLEGAFANGLSDAFTFEGAFELLDSEPGGVENDRFDALARLSWMPRSNDFGVQVEYRTETVDRTAADSADVRRRSLMLRARGDVGARGQVELYAATSDWKDNSSSLLGEMEEDSLSTGRDADVLGARAGMGLGAGLFGAGVRLSGGGAYPSLAADLNVAYPTGPFELEAGLDQASWAGFSTLSWRGGASYAGRLLVPFDVRAFASSGERGIGDPRADTARSIGFSSAGLASSILIGTFEIAGRYAMQKLDEELSLGAAWDSVVMLDAAAVDVSTWEIRVDGPLLPIGELINGLEPVRIRGFYRSNTSPTVLPLYLPADLLRAEFLLHDTFFNDNLELWLSAYIERKGVRRVPQSGSPDPQIVSSYMWPGGQLMIKIGDFRLFYRFVNPNGSVAFDVPGADFPRTLGLFGIRWEFFN